MSVRVVVLGGSFAGMTAAVSLKNELGKEAEVVVVSAADHFVFNPSLIWLPFGVRNRDDITFQLKPTFEKQGVKFVHGSATFIDPVAQKVETTEGDFDYDYLVIATGYRNDMDIVPGMRDTGTITSLPDAERTAENWKKFLEKPGDVIIGATQKASCFGAAYEFLFNTSYQLRKNDLHKKVKLTYVTAEPYSGHFGINSMPGGKGLMNMFMKKEGIEAESNVAMKEIKSDSIVLENGKELPYKFAMVIPPFRGQDFLAKTEGLVDAGNFVKVRHTYQTEKWDNIYGIGIAAAVENPFDTTIPIGIPKTGFPSEQQAHIAAKNIVSQVRGKVPTKQKEFGKIPAICIMDAGNNGVAMLADHLMEPRKAAVMIPGPQNHLAKLAFEKYSLKKMKAGKVNLP